MSLRVAVAKWAEPDGSASAICEALSLLGHQPTLFKFDEPVPARVEAVFSFGPYGRLLPLVRQLAHAPAGERPVFAHWNTESSPDPRIPWPVNIRIARLRSALDRLNDVDRPPLRILLPPLLRWVNGRAIRYRLLGEYHYAYQRRWIDVFADCSQLYAAAHGHHGLPALFVPWGTPPGWHAPLGLQRDIEVLWMGKRRNARRSNLIDEIRRSLSARGIKMHVIDGVENPFVHGETRTRLLNRTRITLNLITHAYDNVLPWRLNVAAANRSLVVSEPEQPHCPIYEAGTHYVVAPPRGIADAIIRYLDDDVERCRIVENAHALVTTQLSLQNSVDAIMAAVRSAATRAGGPDGRPRQAVGSENRNRV